MYRLNCFSLFLVLSVISFAIGMKSSKDMEGYPEGYLESCPGSTKKAVITKKSLHRMGLVVQGRGNPMSARRVIYNYFQMKQLAKDPDIDFSKRTIVYAGGYLDSPNFAIARILGTVYKSLDYNVLAIESHYFVTTEYPVTARFTRAIGKRVAEMLQQLTEEGLDPKKLEIIGVSLGGQTMSYVAKNYRLLTGRNVSRLTGLDPAGPCYRDLGPEDRLDMSDADFVEVLKTNIDGYGMAAPIGHINYYVNGGEFQPGEVSWFPCTMLCSHIRSYFIWISSLYNPGKFIAIQCDSVQQARKSNCFDRSPQVTNTVGLTANKTVQGIFYLSTSNNYPFYLGKKGLKRDDLFITQELIKINSEDVAKM